MVASAGCHEGAGVTAPVSWGSAVVASQWLVVQCQVSSAWLVRVMMAVAPVPAGGALPRRVQPVQAYWVPSAGGGGVMVLVMVALGGCRVMPSSVRMMYSFWSVKQLGNLVRAYGVTVCLSMCNVRCNINWR